MSRKTSFSQAVTTASSSFEMSSSSSASRTFEASSFGVTGGSAASFGVTGGSVASFGVTGGSASRLSVGSASGVEHQVASDLLALNRGNASSFGSAHVSSAITTGGSASIAVGSGAVLSAVEQAILRSQVPIEINESEELTVNFAGKQETGIWSNKSEIVNWRGVIPITEYIINEDLNPEVITKRTEQQLVYIQELAIRYLRPPTPPAPGEIIITQELNSLTPPAPPLVLRQLPARAETPEPLVIREAPPQPPAAVGRKVITISGKRIPPPPRKVIIERLAPLPSKPQSVLVERWLPYAQTKRRVIFQRSNQADPVIVKPRNVIVQWEAPQVVIKKEFKYLGVIRANPVEYVQRYGATLKVARELPDFVLDIKTPEGLVLAADYKYNSVHELEGDVKALSLIDLEREGLAEYRSYLSGLGINFVGAAGVAAAASAFQSSGSSATLAIQGSSIASASVGASLVGSLSVTETSHVNSLIGGSSSAINLGASVSRTDLSSNVVTATSGRASATGVTNEIIVQIFKSIDTDNSGTISIDEAATVLLRLNSRLGRSYGEDEARAFFNVLDTGKRGQLTLEQFKRAFEKL